MSTLATVLTLHTLLIPLDGTGIIDWLTSKNTAVQVLFRGFSITAGIGFVIWQGIKSQGAMSRIIAAGIAAGIFIYFVFSITDIKDRVKTEVGSERPAIVSTWQPGGMSTSPAR
jgi:hypothetical protein